jgi:hypothetical protein
MDGKKLEQGEQGGVVTHQLVSERQGRLLKALLPNQLLMTTPEPGEPGGEKLQFLSATWYQDAIANIHSWRIAFTCSGTSSWGQ